MPKSLLTRVTEQMTCRHCHSRVVTHERLARESALSLRSVVRFLQGDKVARETQAKMEAWLLSNHSD